MPNRTAPEIEGIEFEATLKGVRLVPQVDDRVVELKLVASLSQVGKRGMEAINALVGEACSISLKAADGTGDLRLE